MTCPVAEQWPPELTSDIFSRFFVVTAIILIYWLQTDSALSAYLSMFVVSTNQHRQPRACHDVNVIVAAVYVAVLRRHWRNGHSCCRCRLCILHLAACDCIGRQVLVHVTAVFFFVFMTSVWMSLCVCMCPLLSTDVGCYCCSQGWAKTESFAKV